MGIDRWNLTYLMAWAIVYTLVLVSWNYLEYFLCAIYFCLEQHILSSHHVNVTGMALYPTEVEYTTHVGASPLSSYRWLTRTIRLLMMLSLSAKTFICFNKSSTSGLVIVLCRSARMVRYTGCPSTLLVWHHPDLRAISQISRLLAILQKVSIQAYWTGYCQWIAPPAR